MTTILEAMQAKGIKVVTEEPEKGKSGNKGKGSSPVSVVAKFTFKKPPAIPRNLIPVLQSPEQRREAAEERQRWNREDLIPAMYDCVNGVRGIALISDTNERQMQEGNLEDFWSAITTMLAYDDPDYQSLAVLAYADALVKTCPEDYQLVKELLVDFSKVNFSEEVSDEKYAEDKNADKRKRNGREKEAKVFSWYHKNYRLCREFAENPEAEGVMVAVEQLISRISAGNRERFRQDMAAIKAAVGDSPLTVADLKSGKKNGRIIIPTPDHPNPKYPKTPYKGGILFLESRGGQIHILEGVGGCQKIARQLAETGSYIRNAQLNSERVQFPKDQHLDDDVRKNIHILHGLVYRAVVEAEKAEAADQRRTEEKQRDAAERQEFEAEATVSNVKFFLLEKPGLIVLDPLGSKPFEIKSRDCSRNSTFIPRTFSLVERDDQDRIRVARCPEHLKNFFPVKNLEFVPAGEKFTGIAWPLGILLRMGYAAALAGATPEERDQAKELQAEVQAARKAVEVQVGIKTAAEAAGCSVEELTGVEIPEATEGRV